MVRPDTRRETGRIVDKIVIRLFERMKTAPRSQLIQKATGEGTSTGKQFGGQSGEAPSATERELESYKKRDHQDHQRTGSFGADILGEMIEETRNKLLDLAQELE